MTIIGIVRNVLLAGFGIQEIVKKVVCDLVRKGELSESRGAKLVKVWSEKLSKGSDQLFSELLVKALQRMNLPTKDDIERLSKKLDALSDSIKKIEGERR